VHPRSLRTWGWIGVVSALVLVFFAPTASADTGLADIQIVTDDTGSRLQVDWSSA
jgi:hypothetical protein